MVYWACTRWISSNNVWIWVCDATIALPAGSGTWCPESVPMCDQCTAHDGSGPNTRGTAGFLYVKGCKIWQHAIIGWETLRNLPQCTMDIHGLHNACRSFAAVLVFILLQGFVMERSVLADALNASGGLCPLSGHVYAVSRSTQNHWSASSGETFCRHRVHLKVWALLHQCKRHLLRNCPKSCYPVPWMSMRVTFSDHSCDSLWTFLNIFEPLNFEYNPSRRFAPRLCFHSAEQRKPLDLDRLSSAARSASQDTSNSRLSVAIPALFDSEGNIILWSCWRIIADYSTLCRITKWIREQKTVCKMHFFRIAFQESKTQDPALTVHTQRLRRGKACTEFLSAEAKIACRQWKCSAGPECKLRMRWWWYKSPILMSMFSIVFITLEKRNCSMLGFDTTTRPCPKGKPMQILCRCFA